MRLIGWDKSLDAHQEIKVLAMKQKGSEQEV